MKQLISAILFLVVGLPAESHCQIHVGDTVSFWSVAYIDWQPDPPIKQRIIRAVCRGIGAACYIVVDNEMATPPSPQNISSLIAVFDTTCASRLPQLYGPVPDEFDNNPRVFIVIVPNEGWTGYFDPAHQMPDSLVSRIWGKHSNQREILYLSGDAFGYDVGTIVAHEFGHMLHWGRDHSPEPPGNPVKYWEDAWVDESFATFAPVYLIEDVTRPDVYDQQAYFAVEPDLSLTAFDGGLNYNQVKLWMTFMYEHYGQGGFIHALINEQANGIQGVMNTLETLGYPQTFNETFEQWIISNYLDNRVYLNGKYGYTHYNFPSCRNAAVHTQFPTGTRTALVSSYAVDYIVFSSTIPRDICIRFDGVDTSVFRIAVVRLGNTNSQVFSVESLALDSLNSLSFCPDSFGREVKRLVMVVMNTDPTLGENDKTSYTYSAEIPSGVESEDGRAYAFRLDQSYPNPFNPSTKIGFQIADDGLVTLKVFDMLGREVATLVNEVKRPGMFAAE
jgi:hypothetical protein